MSVVFHIATAMVKAGNMQSYSEVLLNGITVYDSRAQVQAKVGKAPQSSEMPGDGVSLGDYRDEYLFGEKSLNFLFDKGTGKLTLLSARQMPTDLNKTSR